MRARDDTSGTAAAPRRVVFVCWGNICRSPMAERVARGRASELGLTDVEFTSAGTSTEEIGNPMDPRAEAWLQRSGYPTGGHRAHQVEADEIAAADLVVAMEDVHVARMEQISGTRHDHVVLLSSLDPDAPEGSGVPDPWYGGEDGFGDTLASIESAMPGLFRHLGGGTAYG